MDELILRSMKGRTSEAEEARLRTWRQMSTHNEAYARDLATLLEVTETVVLDAETPRPPAVAQLIARGTARSRIEARRSSRRGWGWTGGFAAAAAAVAVLLLGIHAYRQQAPQEFRFGAGEFVTGVAETATVVLADGTVVRLAPESRLRIPGTSGVRDVVLEGRAYFAVAKMDGYPFLVLTRAGAAEVLGTRFEVRTQGDDLRLVVLEGRVALGTGERRVEVQAGEMSLVSDGATTAPLRVEDVKPLVAWLERFIVFQGTPMRDVARELEQEYGVRVELTDDGLANQTITGWYADRTFEDVLTIVCGVLQADCSIREGVATIRPLRSVPDVAPVISTWRADTMTLEEK